MPAAAYVYMGMSESYRGAGWYGTAISDAWNNTNESKDNYLKLISRKIETFINKPSYFLDFYKRKKNFFQKSFSELKLFHHIKFEFFNAIQYWSYFRE